MTTVGFSLNFSSRHPSNDLSISPLVLSLSPVTMGHQRLWHSSPVSPTHSYEYAGQFPLMARRMNSGHGGWIKQWCHGRKNILNTGNQLCDVTDNIHVLDHLKTDDFLSVKEEFPLTWRLWVCLSEWKPAVFWKKKKKKKGRETALRILPCYTAVTQPASGSQWDPSGDERNTLFKAVCRVTAAPVCSVNISYLQASTFCEWHFL